MKDLTRNINEKFKFFKIKALPCILGTPCVHGTCYNNYTGGYDCACVNGYIGKNCTIRKLVYNHSFILFNLILC